VTSKSRRDNKNAVNIRVPFQLLRSGIKLASLLPAGIQDKVNHALQENGIDVDVSRIRAEDLEDLVEALSEIRVDVDSGGRAGPNFL